MRAVSGAGLGLIGRSAIGADVVHLLATGQSLSVGQQQIVPVSTTQPYRNRMIFDAAGVYDISDPSAPTLRTIPLVAPQRPVLFGQMPYPQNLQGESADVSACNMIAALALDSAFAAFAVADSCVGQSGAVMGVIEKGGTGNAYDAGLYEAQVYKRLAGDAGESIAPLGVLLTHGETNAIIGTSTASYEASLQTLWSDYQTDLRAIYATAAEVPMWLSQQNSCPTSFAGMNTTAIAQWKAAALNPSIVLTGPKYQYDYTGGGNLHISLYPPVGEKYAEVIWWTVLALQGRRPRWQPLWPTSFVRVGTLVTIGFFVPFAPMIFDMSKPAPHQIGTPFPMWAAGNGFEARDNPLTVAGTVNASPIGVSFTAPHGLTTGDTYALTGIAGTTNANNVWTVTVTGPSSITLDGSIGNGGYAGGGEGFSPIGIVSAVLTGSHVAITLARMPGAGLSMSYGHIPDRLPYDLNVAYTGGFGIGGRVGLLRDSDPFRGPSLFRNYNWCVEFDQAVA
jgi:hypothetical protein